MEHDTMYARKHNVCLQKEERQMEIGSKVEHVSYPGQIGKVVAKSKKWGSQLQTILVMWDKDKNLSRHIPSALRVHA
jgi:hypothetical protein|tara:strand:- start:99 stop:329 length:231 start_codon:yes stop_codon:yes gene_type:complete